MARAKSTAKPSTQEAEYWLVNPAGAIHQVTKEIARARLRQPGYRLATKDEVATRKGVKEQRFDTPIAAPFNPDAALDAIEAGVAAQMEAHEAEEG